MKKSEEDGEDVPDPARVPEQRPHRPDHPCDRARWSRAMLEGATAAPRHPCETRRRPIREGGLLLPFATGPDEIREGPARPAVEQGRPHPRPRAASRVRSARPSRTLSVDARLALVEGVGEATLSQPLRVCRRVRRRSGRSARPLGASARGGPCVDLGLRRLERIGPPHRDGVAGRRDRRISHAYHPWIDARVLVPTDSPRGRGQRVYPSGSFGDVLAESGFSRPKGRTRSS